MVAFARKREAEARRKNLSVRSHDFSTCREEAPRILPQRPGQPPGTTPRRLSGSAQHARLIRMRRTEQLVAVALMACISCLVYPVLAAPVPQTIHAQPLPAAGAAGGRTGAGAAGSDAVAADTTSPAKPAGPLHTHGYFCKLGSCNVCHFRPSEIQPASAEPMPNGDCPQARVEGTNVTKAELAEKGLRYLQVGGDWWNKCGDGWLNSDFIFTRLPVGFVCEDWRTGRYILRQDAGHRWPFEDGSFEIVYSEHMFEHILPMDGSTFLKEMYRVLRPGGGMFAPPRACATMRRPSQRLPRTAAVRSGGGARSRRVEWPVAHVRG